MKKKHRFIVKTRAAKTELGRAVTYELERVRCNNKKCRRCTSSDRAPHGPYWYARWRGADGRVRKKYVGRVFRSLRESDLGIVRVRLAVPS